MQFTISRPQEERTAQRGEEAASPAACPIDFNADLDAQKRIKKLGFGFGQEVNQYRS
jgi:hypothetical protein